MQSNYILAPQVIFVKPTFPVQWDFRLFPHFYYTRIKVIALLEIVFPENGLRNIGRNETTLSQKERFVAPLNFLIYLT